MATIDGHAGPHQIDSVVERARRAGFELGNRETDTGQIVWEWRCGDGPCPQFVTQRVACHWMAEWIEYFDTTGPE